MLPSEGSREVIDLDQRLALVHGLSDLANDVFPVMAAHQDDAPTTTVHAAHPTQSMDEINRRVGDIVEDNMAHGHGIDAARS